jgi:hypothetical protein
MKNSVLRPSTVSRTRPFIAVWVLLSFLALSYRSAHAQQTSSDSQQTPPTQNQPAPSPKPGAPASQPPPGTNKSEAEKDIEQKEQSQRAFGVLPQFGMTSRQDAPPLTNREKFHLFAKSAFDPVTIGIVGVQAALSQGENEFPAYGQGAQGYGKRFGASLADEVSSGFWSNYFYPVLLKEDPRYFRLGEGSLTHRIGYGIKQEFVCHTDSGGRAFNFSNVLGAFTSGAVSNIYYPGRSIVRTIPATATTPAMPVYEDDRGAVLTISRASIALGYGVVGGLFDEFWPDIQHKIFHKRIHHGDTPNQ